MAWVEWRMGAANAGPSWDRASRNTGFPPDRERNGFMWCDTAPTCATPALMCAIPGDAMRVGAWVTCAMLGEAARVGRACTVGDASRPRSELIGVAAARPTSELLFCTATELIRAAAARPTSALCPAAMADAAARPRVWMEGDAARTLLWVVVCATTLFGTLLTTTFAPSATFATSEARMLLVVVKLWMEGAVVPRIRPGAGGAMMRVGASFCEEGPMRGPKP
mmetsp:Transcript_27036/g.64501  ORF Transcript_27036/g.64501 Transcript_27036/m.64501 type:complete len:223 (+) Transcript_27036:341-1009(+)